MVGTGVRSWGLAFHSREGGHLWDLLPSPLAGAGGGDVSQEQSWALGVLGPDSTVPSGWEQ